MKAFNESNGYLNWQFFLSQQKYGVFAVNFACCWTSLLAYVSNYVHPLISRMIYVKDVLSLTMNFAVTGSQRPSYPSSRPTRDWDKIEAQVKKEVCLLSLCNVLILCILVNATLASNS